MEVFHDKLKRLVDEYAHNIYSLTRKFPKEELYGLASQLRRSSIARNYIEGYARRRSKVNKNFLEMSYGSLQESKYLLDFSLKEGYLEKEEFDRMNVIAEEIGAMLWSTMEKLND
jgi:four helix bundle protein